MKTHRWDLPPQPGQKKQSRTYQLMVKRAKLALVAPVEPLEDDLMIGSSNLETDHAKIPSKIHETSPPLKPTNKHAILIPTSFFIHSTSPPSQSLASVSTAEHK